MAEPLSRIDNAVLVLPAGGKGERLAALPEARGLNKAALQADGHSLIARTAKLYVDAGIRDIVVLVGHKAESVKKALRSPALRRAKILFSQDPPTLIGKGGAIRLAMERGLLPKDRPFIVHNPDDQIVKVHRRFPKMIWAKHRMAERNGAVATAVCVPETDYAYSAFVPGTRRLAKSAVMYPKVKMPTHIGVTVFSANASSLFATLIPLNRKTDFEAVVLPVLAKRRQLGLAMIPAGCWIPVNDLKGYRALLSAL